MLGARTPTVRFFGPSRPEFYFLTSGGTFDKLSAAVLSTSKGGGCWDATCNKAKMRNHGRRTRFVILPSSAAGCDTPGG